MSWLDTALAAVQLHHRTGTSCVAENGFCPGWIADNWNIFVHPFWQHVFLTLVPVVLGFVIAFGLALIAHKYNWLTGFFVGLSEVLYTIPSLAAFLILLPITGFGNTTAIITLTAYALQSILSNILLGLRNVPEHLKDAGRGMGLTDNQLLWRVELPTALPEILAGLRIAVTTTVGLATLAFFAGAGGLGEVISADNYQFKSKVVIAGALAVLLAAVLDLVILGVQRLVTPWRRAAA
jgi:osmoprotectant transport system permease protein